MCECCVNEDGTVEIEGRKMSYIDPLTDWGFKKNLSRLMERPVELQERIFRKLFEAALIAAFTREELDEYTNDMMTENDRKNAIDYARKQGRAEGRAEGLAEGEIVGKLSVAQRMFAAGLDPKMISEMTGLTEPEIRGL